MDTWRRYSIFTSRGMWKNKIYILYIEYKTINIQLYNIFNVNIYIYHTVVHNIWIAHLKQNWLLNHQIPNLVETPAWSLVYFICCSLDAWTISSSKKIQMFRVFNKRIGHKSTSMAKVSNWRSDISKFAPWILWIIFSLSKKQQNKQFLHHTQQSKTTSKRDRMETNPQFQIGDSLIFLELFLAYPHLSHRRFPRSQWWRHPRRHSGGKGGGASTWPGLQVMSEFFLGGHYMCHGQKSLYWGWSSHL